MQWRFKINGKIVAGTIRIAVAAVSVSMICGFAAILFLPDGFEYAGTTLTMSFGIALLASVPIGYVITAQSVRLAELNKLLLHEANYDPLTKIMNRRAFFAAIEQYRASDEDVAVLLIDADHFKLINERHGHHSGDEALKLLARTLKDTLGPDAILGRIGGEEFGVILHSCSIPRAVEIACRVNSAISGLNFITPENRSCPLTVSIGVDMLGKAETEYPLRGADNALHVAKQSGRNGVVAYDDATMRDSRDKAA